MEIQEEVALQRKGYQENVKSLIERGAYHTAGMEMSNLTFAMAERRNDIVNGVHCGLSYLATAELLKEALLEGNERSIRGFKEKFEAFSAQTKLPLRD